MYFLDPQSLETEITLYRTVYLKIRVFVISLNSYYISFLRTRLGFTLKKRLFSKEIMYFYPTLKNSRQQVSLGLKFLEFPTTMELKSELHVNFYLKFCICR